MTADQAVSRSRLSMLGNRSRDTRPELAVRRACHALGLRYRVCAPLPGIPRRSADLLFTRAKVAVMVDGCFWHGCPVHRARHWSGPYWQAKIEGNQARDADTNTRLIESGWLVIRVWEHQDPQAAAVMIAAIVGKA